MTTETWYRVNGVLDIEPVEVQTWTTKTLTLANGRRVKRENTWEEYFPTWERARARAIQQAESCVEIAEANVILAKKRLTEAKRLPERAPHGT